MDNQTGQSGHSSIPDALEHISKSGVDLESVDPGSCYTEYFTEAQYRTVSLRVLKKAGFERITVIPAEFEPREERILVKEASTKVVDVPAVYRTETESVLVEPARSVWQEGCGIVERVDNTTGETMCMVQIPARYETLTKTVLDKPASTKTVTIPAVYETVTVQRQVKPAAEKIETVPPEFATVSRRAKVSDPEFFWLAKGEKAEENAKATGREICLTERTAEFVNVTREVVVTPAKVTTEAVPAAFESISVQKLVKPASERRIVIPARTKTVTSQKQVAPSRLEWRKVLCDINMTKRTITNLQLALKREGYNPGPIDGIVGRATMNAMEKFQIDEGIDQRGLTYEALQLLDVQP